MLRRCREPLAGSFTGWNLPSPLAGPFRRPTISCAYSIPRGRLTDEAACPTVALTASQNFVSSEGFQFLRLTESLCSCVCPGLRLRWMPGGEQGRQDGLNGESVHPVSAVSRFRPQLQ